jgi:hypothetical protein
LRITKRIRFHTETARTIEEKYRKHIKIYTDGSKKDGEVGPKSQIRKRLQPQNTVFSIKQEVIIKAIQVSERMNDRRVIITDSLSTLMAIEETKNQKNPKIRRLRKILDDLREPGVHGNAWKRING